MQIEVVNTIDLDNGRVEQKVKRIVEIQILTPAPYLIV
jgi:hypothetical protein